MKTWCFGVMTWEDGRRAVALIEAILASSKSGQEVRLDD